MRLLKFKVRDFRSVDDSGWIESSEVTALIGTNESGKTNLLLPLWKLNPAGKDGAIDLLADAPRKRYNEIRSGEKTEIFIEAVFEVTDELAADLAEKTGATAAEMKQVAVSRRYNGKYFVTFPLDNPRRTIPRTDVSNLLDNAAQDIAKATPLKTEEAVKAAIEAAIQKATTALPVGTTVNVVGLNAMHAALHEPQALLDAAPKTSVTVPRFIQLREAVDNLIESVSRPTASSIAEARQAALDELPKFVYYSNYGNLDSEIYLPHVIENMKREGIGSKEAAKARTLKVLFEFVKLEPDEILELGKDLPAGHQATDKAVADIGRKKKERDVLLQSASTDLTQKFRDWWKQGEYRFRFQADGDHFRIWVSDDKRPEDIELEGRSTGLQWFLSFYLIFLVESQDAHEGAILLLDEPGLSLHPLAQRDLSQFFESLAATNQLMYTTHSPFLVDPNHLDRVRAVFIEDDGTTGVSSDLRAGEKQQAQSRSIYPVNAALGLTVSETLFVGAEPIVVEGTSDQYYLSAMKILLIGAGKLSPLKELVFVPAGGVRGVKAVAGILGGRDETLPVVLTDSDDVGKKFASDLRNSLYSGSKERVLDLDNFAPVKGSEIEDMIPEDIMVAAVSKLLRGPDEDFSDVHRKGEAIVPQIERYASDNSITLEPGWKVELARQLKTRLLKAGTASVDEGWLDRWKTLFLALQPDTVEKTID